MSFSADFHLLHIKKSRTTPYHPQGNGLVERFNCTLVRMLAITIADYPQDWEELLPKLCLAYNSSVQATTGFTPFFLMFGRQVSLPVDVMFGTSTEMSEKSLDHYAASLQWKLQYAYGLVQQKFKVVQECQKEFYDTTVHGEPYKEGGLAWLYTTVIPKGTHRKFHHPWSGPYCILKKLFEVNYRIQNLQSHRKMIVHFNRLKRCHPNVRLDKDISINNEKNQQIIQNLSGSNWETL